MDAPRAPADNPLWRFCLERYGRPGVREHCLVLQDESGVDIALLFACAWLATQGADPVHAAPLLKRALEQTRALRAEVLWPLRGARRRMKALDLGRDAEAVRERIKQVELEAEALYVSHLHGALVDAPRLVPPDHFRHPPVRAGVRDVRAWFDAYLRLEGLALADDAQRRFTAVAASLLEA